MTARAYRFVTSGEVEAEIAEAARWYETQVRGLGHEFLRAFRAATAVLHRDPLHDQVIEDDIRRILLRRFPYAVFYEVHSADVVILACLHTSREPEEWRQRGGL